MAKGFMKISREKLDSWCWRCNMNKNYLMMYLLVRANFKDEPFETITVKRGQLVFSYDKLSMETGMPLQTLRTTLRDLEKTNQITTKSTRKWSLLTICEYEDWQESGDKANTQSDTQSDTNRINKEIQELKEENKRLKEELTNVSKKKREKVELDLSVVAPEFLDVVNEWLQYKKERKEGYTPTGLTKFYKQLLKLSGNSPEKAKLIVEQSMANNWAGIFELKQQPTRQNAPVEYHRGATDWDAEKAIAEKWNRH